LSQDDDDDNADDDDLWLSSSMKQAIHVEKEAEHHAEAKSLLSKADKSKVSLIFMLVHCCLWRLYCYL